MQYEVISGMGTGTSRDMGSWWVWFIGYRHCGDSLRDNPPPPSLYGVHGDFLYSGFLITHLIPSECKVGTKAYKGGGGGGGERGEVSHIHTHTYIHTCMYIHPHIHTCIHMHTHTCTHMHMHIHAHTHTCTHTHTHAHTHICMHTVT